MNCKPGDLAVMIRSLYGNLGKVVKVIEPFVWVNGQPRQCSGANWDPRSGLFWLVESLSGPIVSDSGLKHVIRPCPDSFLRPIRDQPGTDEIIRIAGKPRKETVK